MTTVGLMVETDQLQDSGYPQGNVLNLAGLMHKRAQVEGFGRYEVANVYNTDSTWLF